MKKLLIPALLLLMSLSATTTSCSNAKQGSSDSDSTKSETLKTDSISPEKGDSSVAESQEPEENGAGEESEEDWAPAVDKSCDDWDIEDGVRAYFTSECTKDLDKILMNIRAYTPDEQRELSLVENLISSPQQEVKPSDLVDVFHKVRSIQITQNKGAYPTITGYSFMNCNFNWEVATLWCNKTSGSQRKMLQLHCWPSKHILVDGIWYVAGEEKKWDDDHKCTGVLQKNEHGDVYMILQDLHSPYEEQFEVLIFSKN